MSKNMKTAGLVLIILVLVGVMATSALLLVGAADASRDLLTDWVENNVEDHPTINEIVERIPSDCLACHRRGSHGSVLNELE